MGSVDIAAFFANKPMMHLDPKLAQLENALSRDTHLERLKNEHFDVFVLGGGINGAASAACLAHRGLKVALVDQGDFACQSSSNSSNLIWGGIKYLESGELALVNSLCRSRNRLMKAYPNNVEEIRFLASLTHDFRLPAVMLYLGSLLYWFLGRCQTRAPKWFSRSAFAERCSIVKENLVRSAIEYSDMYLPENDARFVFQFIQKATYSGALVANYVCAKQAHFVDDGWQLTLKDTRTEESFTLQSKVFINCAGGMLDTFNQSNQLVSKYQHILSKGTHLIINKLDQVKRVLTFFASDGRMFFAIPMGNKTCLGTTDTPSKTPYVFVEPEDRAFILDNINRVLNLENPIKESDIIAERSGVRPLVCGENKRDSKWQKISRKHVLDVQKKTRQINIFGGKLTDCLNIGEEVASCVEKMGFRLNPKTGNWFGESEENNKYSLRSKLQSLRNCLNVDKAQINLISDKLWRRYDLNAIHVVNLIEGDRSLAEIIFADPLTLAAEVAYARDNEWIVTLEDFVRRRTLISLVNSDNSLKNTEKLLKVSLLLFGENGQKKLDEYWQNRNKNERLFIKE